MRNLVPHALLAGLTVSFIAGCTAFGGKAADEPRYRVVESEGSIEIREYDAFAVAQATVDAQFDDAIRQGFRRLFDYISGANRMEADIEMTAPVLVNATSMSMDAKAPVFVLPRDGSHSDSGRRSNDAGIGGWTTSFVLAAGYTEQTAPPPNDPGIAIRDVGAGRVASISFAGRFRNRTAEAHGRDLARWLAERGLEHKGDWRIAGYNPPWTIPTFRRNEVLVTLQ